MKVVKIVLLALAALVLLMVVVVLSITYGFDANKYKPELIDMGDRRGDIIDIIPLAHRFAETDEQGGELGVGLIQLELTDGDEGIRFGKYFFEAPLQT